MIGYLKNCTLLYVEDEETILHEMTHYFKSYFLTVYTAQNGKEALELYKKLTPDVVIIDMMIPGINGIELIKRIRSLSNYSRIIVLSAHSNTDLLLEAIELNLSKYLLKPPKLSEMKEALHKVSKELLELSKDTVHLNENTYYMQSSKQLIHNSVPVALSIKEGLLLKLLISKVNSPVSIEDIIAHVWEDDIFTEISKDSVKSLVSNLRKKLPENSIKNVYGVGYQLTL
jgi:DNA-binding response OmpR family regulator